MSSQGTLKYQPSSQIVASEVSGETVILDYEAGKYFGLEGVGNFVWNVLQKQAPLSLSELCDMVMAEYEVDESQCIKDLKALLSNLEKNGLIQTAS